MRIIIVSAEKVLDGESVCWTELFENGLETLHLRKREIGCEVLEGLIREVPEKHRRNIVVQEHAHLVDLYDLKGVHFSSQSWKVQPEFSRKGTVSCSLHAEDEPGSERNADYIYLSPLFDSISKRGYKSNMEAVTQRAESSSIPAIALGGINPETIRRVPGAFKGVATLGYIWNDFERNRDVEGVVERFKKLKEFNRRNAK